MNTFEAIAQRRSIRKFQETPVSDDIIVKILDAAIQAPSGKNKQPWRFIVVKEDKRAEMVRLLREGIAKCKAQGIDPGSSEGTARIMAQAPATIFVFNPFETDDGRERTIADYFANLVDVQSVGAAIQNMLLAAQDLGLGTLWICDVFYAYQELCAWLGEKHQLIAAISLGYPGEQPAARPRRSVNEVTTWL